MTPLADLQELYDRHRFLDAYQQSAERWSLETPFDQLANDELLFAGRLAVRVGGWRLGRHLLRAAYGRAPEDSRIRYFSRHVRRRRVNVLDELQELETYSTNNGDAPEMQASWLAHYALTLAMLRDFSRAHECLERAFPLGKPDGWVRTCEAYVYGLEDRWGDARESAEQAWAMNPGAPYTADAMANSLLNLGRVRESARWLGEAAEGSQSYEIVYSACWHHCALAETLEGAEREAALERAGVFVEMLPGLLPLADKESRAMMARARLDIAALKNDHAEMERQAAEMKSPYYRRVLDNLRRNPGGTRIRLAFPRAVQRQFECLPTSLQSALGTQGVSIEAERMAAEITFGGTPEWAAAEWLEKRGLAVRFFAVTADLAAALVKRGIGFVVTLETDENAHAVAAVGLDEAAGTVLIHDPSAFRTTEYLLEFFAEHAEPLGIRGMAAVPAEKAATLDELLSKDSVELAAAAPRWYKAIVLQGPSAARQVVSEMAARQPEHPGTRLLAAMQAAEDGCVGESLRGYQELLNAFPNSMVVRGRMVRTCRWLGNTALVRETLAGVVERGALPGIHSQQDWLHPPGQFTAQYAEYLRHSEATRDYARRLLEGALRRDPSLSGAWHILADVLWDERETEKSLLAYRIASCLDPSSEEWAIAYCDALCLLHRKEEGFAWLERRVRRFGGVAQAAAAWVSWIRAQEQWGHPEGALAAAAEALRTQPDSAELLSFAAAFLARMGRWEEAGEELRRLEKTGHPALYAKAAMEFHRLHGEPEKAQEHAEAWLREAPRDLEARSALLDCVAQREGMSAATRLAGRWRREFPAHDDIESLYYRRWDAEAKSRFGNYSVLRRRVKRNPEDGWAWREIALCRIADYELADKERQARLRPRIEEWIAECERTAPDDAATFVVHGRWHEARGEWKEAVAAYLESIERDPATSHGYERAWDCSWNFSGEERRRLWEQVEKKFLRGAGHLTVAADAVTLAARRFGVAAAEESVKRWLELRPDDPELTRAYAALLLDRGQGRCDAARALAMLAPAVERFPHHLGLRFLLSSAHRQMGDFAAAEEVVREILRRHPGNTSGHLHMAWVQERNGNREAARRWLETAAAKEPFNFQIYDALAQLLMRGNEFEEARRLIAEVLERAPANVYWRERAIRLLVDCGDEAGAVAAAREGVRVYPRGAYMWCLLGATLQQHRRFAESGEIEESLRRSLALNQGLFDAADLLAMVLAEQKQYEEAAEVMKQILPRMGDASPARGRLAWIHRQQGKRAEARAEMAAAVRDTPGYAWGWLVLMEWLVEDSDWNLAGELLGEVRPELATQLQFRQQRLQVLERARLGPRELDEERRKLLADFPEEVPLHLECYDRWHDAKRLPEAYGALKAIQAVEPENPFLLARLAEMQLEEKQNEAALETLERLCFAEVESSAWPMDYAWAAVQKAKLEETAEARLRKKLEEGARPTLRGFFVLAAHLLERGGTNRLARQPHWRIWFPDRGARELLKLLEVAERMPWADGRYREIIFDQLSGHGYAALVIKHWKTNRAKVEAEVPSWAQVGRALSVLERKKELRELLADWRTRPGVGMWTVANYVGGFNPLRREHLREIAATCRNALNNLPHDHCARYLAHRAAEACALLGDLEGFRDVWERCRPYFTTRQSAEEWFHEQCTYLLEMIPEMGAYLEQGKEFAFRRKTWGLRLSRIARLQIQ